MDGMNLSTYVVRKLRKTSPVAEFNCGDQDLNDFVRNEAIDYQNARLSTTYLLISMEQHVDAFFSLAHDRISLSLSQEALS